MLAVYITKPGGPQTVRIRETSKPERHQGEALVRVKAAGLNYAEIVVRRGLYPDAPKCPFIPGYELSGIIEEVGSDSDLRAGDRVMGANLFGCQAEYATLPVNQLFRIPDNLSFQQAAAIPVNYLTAYYAVFQFGNLEQGDKVLIHSCAGGVGTAAVQLAQTKKAEVFGTTSRPEKVEYLRQIGVQHPINYKAEDFVETVQKVAGKKGIDLVLDPVGGPVFRKSFRLLRPGGRIVCYGVADLTAGGKRNFPRLLWKFLTLPRPSTLELMQHNRGIFGLALNRLLDNPERLKSIIEKLLGFFEAGSIKPNIYRTYDFRQVSEAHAELESGKTMGKIILKFD